MTRGFQESVVCVDRAEERAQQLCQLSGWREVLRAESDPRLLRAWGLPGSCVGRELLLGAPRSSTGHVRLLQLDGVEQRPIRSNPQSWDVGGHLDLNVRVTDMSRRFRDFCDAGWHANSDAVEWTFGDKRVSEWLTLGPDGLALALIERLAPPLDPDAVPGGFGHCFNSSQVVADMGRALEFYEKALGFHKFLHICRPLLSEPGANPLGIPHNLVSQLDVEIVMLSPSGEMDGSVELIRMHGLEGRDFSASARPPNRGILSLRFPVPDLEELQQRLRSANQPLAMAPAVVTLEPWGECELLAVQAPDGAWLEFFTGGNPPG